MVKQRVIVYVDGFNFYYGLKRNPRWKRYYWIDFVRLFESFMKPHQELVAVKYFSAKPISNEDKAERQSLLFKANEENPRFQLVLGKYLQKSLTCKNCGYKITTYEEKKSMPHRTRSFLDPPLWITFRQIIFPSPRPSDRPKVDLDGRPRNLRVDKKRLASRRFLCTFVALFGSEHFYLTHTALHYHTMDNGTHYDKTEAMMNIEEDLTGWK